MPSVAEHGWSDFTLGEERAYSLRYLTDVALEWIGQDLSKGLPSPAVLIL